MKTDQRLRDSLVNNGFALIPQVLTPSEVANLRTVCAGLHARYQERNLLVSKFLAVPELASVPFMPTVVGGLRSALGSEYTTIPEFTVQTASYGAWHTDGQSQRDEHLFDPDFLQVECAVYLQDNTVSFGGGLDVIPGSHREFLTGGHPYSPLRRVLRRVANSFRRPISVATKAGDLVAFHFRLLHRSTPHRASSVPPENTKYGIFWGAASKDAHASKYMEHMRYRGEKLGQENYAEIAKVKFPDSYPAEVVSLARRQQLKIASF